MFETIRLAVLADKVPYLEGPPGWGKSAVLKCLASQMGVRLLIVYLAQKAGNEIHGIPVVSRSTLEVDGHEYTVVEQAPPAWAVQARHEPNGVFIFFDEANQLPPNDMGQVMSILTERMVGDVALPRDRVAMVAAGNPSELSAGGWRIPLPARRRLVKLQMELDAMAFCAPECFPNNWGYALPPIVKFGKTLDVERRLRKRTLVAAWVHAHPDVFNLPKDITKMYEGFACPATCEDASDLLASVEQYHDNPKTATAEAQKLLVGVMGEAGASLLDYVDNVSAVPAASDVLDDPDGFVHAGVVPPPDRLYYFLMSLAEECRFRTARSREKSGARVLEKAQQAWYNAHAVVPFLQKSGAPVDLLCMYVGNLQTREAQPKGTVPPAVVDEFAPLLATMRAAGVNWVKLSGQAPGK